MERYYKKDDRSLTFIDVSEEVLADKRQAEIRLYSLIFIAIILLGLYALQSIRLNECQTKITEQEQFITYLQSSDKVEFNLRAVDEQIDALPFKDKKFVKRQYRLESGNLTSKLTRTHKNIFGMKNATGKRKKSQPGFNGGEYRAYKDFRHCIFDRYMWEVYGGNMNNYAEDSQYFYKLAILKN